ncbi:hypothetical protein PUNSTDRAFT_104143 [Punctularia strigosozonata HHB-11173 SS5]|uniref:uncharacterized protein n=1 Tax=Punctularia strigosozonata (strain HHB-11173) TaxID=741275 RepID=UPI00044172A4|nr:uncharacterized protein PUNSTDRAFT_104143 [Punctularia strigosozonata HHB-11173 SS5]EIN07972.1 hypothetical protein PUNSTDRAFT_104143 [Punctularia strigosozonata HHB-11173 SS5]
MSTSTVDGSGPAQIRPLSASQERRLVDHVEDKMLQITRSYKKRSLPMSDLSTMIDYLNATHSVMSLILQIPPVDPSASLRTTLLLRLTGEALACIPGYVPDTPSLVALLEWLDDLDKGWLAVLRREPWDPALRSGVEMPCTEDEHAKPMTQTERTRLRSLIMSGTDTLEEWLSTQDVEREDFRQALERMGAKQGFDDIFTRTLGELGSLHGTTLLLDNGAGHPQATA